MKSSGSFRHKAAYLAVFMAFCLGLAPLSAQTVPAQTASPDMKPIPEGPLPQAQPIPDSSSPQTKQVPAGPQPPAYAVPHNTESRFAAWAAYDPLGVGKPEDALGATYIPVDDRVYPMALRLYSLGYLDTAFIGLRPWTRRSLLHALDASKDRIMEDNNDEAVALYAGLRQAVDAEIADGTSERGTVYGFDTFYTRIMGISGTTLRDSYHLGQTIANDYGRPYEAGLNNITGFSSVNELGRLSLYVRGEYQHAPSANGYSTALASQLSTLDTIPYSGSNLNQATIPQGPISAQNPFRLQEATLSFHLLGNEISGGKSDAWLGPAAGGAMAWSNNAENIYSFRINRVEPLHIPFLSALLGPVRYDFMVGSLKGHTDPNSPWVHTETLSFAPTPNVRFAFQRTAIWGGAGHEPVTLYTFLRSFFSISDTTPAEKNSAQDPGARFGDFSFSWRLPYLSHHLTLYTDSIAHDDVTPPSAPRRAAYRPGLYLSQFPGIPKLDLRVEAVSTDTSTLRSQLGQFNYFEPIQAQGYTNKGFIMGDWIGREAKGGQAWLTYHLSANEWIQLEYLNKKTPKDFIAGGTTQNQFKIEVVKQLRKQLELDAWYQYEGWKAPIYIPGNALNKDSIFAFQFTWFPKLRTSSSSSVSSGPPTIRSTQ